MRAATNHHARGGYYMSVFILVVLWSRIPRRTCFVLHGAVRGRLLLSAVRGPGACRATLAPRTCPSGVTATEGPQPTGSNLIGSEKSAALSDAGPKPSKIRMKLLKRIWRPWGGAAHRNASPEQRLPHKQPDDNPSALRSSTGAMRRDTAPKDSSQALNSLEDPTSIAQSDTAAPAHEARPLDGSIEARSSGGPSSVAKGGAVASPRDQAPGQDLSSLRPLEGSPAVAPNRDEAPEDDPSRPTQLEGHDRDEAPEDDPSKPTLLEGHDREVLRGTEPLHQDSVSNRRPFKPSVWTLKEGTRYTGTVIRLVDAGFFVDVGVRAWGFVYNTDVGQGFAVRPPNTVRVGQEVQVWVIKVKSDRKLLLSCFPPRDLSYFVGVPVDEWHSGVVISITWEGAYIRVSPNSGRGRPQMGRVRRNNVRAGWVKDLREEMYMGMKVRVRVLSVEGGKMELSLRGL